MPNITNITPPRVPLTDPRTGLITREWYRFFLNLFTLVGNGSSDASIQDLLIAPGNRSEELAARVNEIYAQLINQPANISSELQAQINDLRQLVLTLPRPDLGTMAAVEQDSVRYLGFQTSPSINYTPPVGTVYWDGGTTLQIQNTANVAQPVGEAQYYYIKATATISKGQLIMYDGSVGASGQLKGKPATSLTSGEYIMGVAAEDIATNAFGIVTSFGLVRGFNTTGSPYGETWADGDILYYNPSYAGGLTKTLPSAPNVKSVVAAVVTASSGGSGSVFVRINAGSQLGQTDSNVQFGTLNNGDLIQYDSVLGYWKNVAASTIGTVSSISFGTTGLTPSTPTTGAVTVAGTLAVANGGTNNSSAYTTKGVMFFDGTKITQNVDINTSLAWDNVNYRFGVGTLTPETKFELYEAGNVNVAARITGAIASGYEAQLQFTRYGGTSVNAQISCVAESFNDYGVIKFSTTGASGLLEAGRFDSTQEFYLGVAGTRQGRLRLNNTSANYVTVISSNSTSATWTLTLPVSAGTNGYVLATDGAGATYWTAAAVGSVTSVSVVSANGLAGTVANASTTPAITLSTTITGVLKGDGTAISAAVAATDYVAPSAYASANGLTMATSRLLGRTTAATGAAEEISVGTGLSLSAGSLSNSSPMTYPGSGIPNSTGSAWGTSYSTTGTGAIVALATSPSFTTPSLGNASAGSINGTTIGLGGGNVTSNLSVGQSSLLNNTTGNNNTAIGAQSLYTVTTGTYNTAIGGSAGFTTNGTNNVFIGSTAGYYTTGSYNVALGRNALYGVAASTTGDFNVAVGYAALFGITGGTTNTCIGYASGYGLTSGNYNVIVGAYRGALTPISATGSNYIVMSDGQQNVAGYWLGTTGAMTNIGSITAPSFIPNSSTVPSNGVYLPAANTVGVASNSTAVIQVLKGSSVALEGASVQVGTGITFPAAQVASADANTLDDYVEGSFTPIIRFGGGTTGVTYTTQTGRYTKIGRFVHLYIRIVLSNKGSSTGAATVVAGTGSFPSAGDNSVGSFDPAVAMASLTAGGAVLPVISTTTINLVQQTTTARAALTDANFTNTSDFRITICYAV